MTYSASLSSRACGCLLLLIGALSNVALAAPGGVDLSFDAGSGVNGEVKAMALQSDGKLLIAGSFTTVRGLARASLARLNADGSGDPTFNAETNADRYVSAIAVDPDGKVLLTRDFANFNGDPLGKVERLNTDGTLDTSFAPAAETFPSSSALTCVAVQSDGKIVLGGYTLEVDEFGSLSPRSLLVRLHANGAIDDSFTNANGTFGGRVSALALQPDGKLLIAGEIVTSVNGTSHYSLARLNANGTVDTNFQYGADGIIHSVGLQPDGKILLAGYGIGNSTNRNGVARLNADGGMDGTFQPGCDANSSLVTVVAQSDGKVVCLGSYVYVDGTDRNGIVRLNSNGSVDAGFNAATGAPNNATAAIVLQPDGKLLISGGFTLVNGINREGLARLNIDGSLDTTFVPGSSINAAVRSLALEPNGKVIIGGNFTKVGGVLRNCVARLNANGSLDTSFDPGTGAGVPFYGSLHVNVVARQPDGKLLVGGDFSSFNGISRNRIARLNADGTVDTSFVPWTGTPVVNYAFEPQAILIQRDGKILVGGNAALGSGNDGAGLARLNPDGSFDNSFHADTLGTSGGDFAVINSLALQPDWKILAGGYSVKSFGNYLMTRLNPDGSRDASFVGAGGNGLVTSIALQQPDGKILVASGWDDAGGWVARLNTNGTVDATFNAGSGANNMINSVLLQPDGKVLIAGSFTSFNGTNCNHVARLNANGVLDATFNVTESVSVVSAGALQNDGGVLVAGGFITASGILRSPVARLDGGGPISQEPWTYHEPGSYDNVPIALAVAGNGNVVVTGTSADDFGFTSWLTVAWSSNGDLLWTQSYHGPVEFTDAQPNAVAVDAAGNVFVAGVAVGINGDQDYVTIKYSSTGVALWTRSYNGPGNGHDGAIAAAVDSAGNVIVTGISPETADSTSGSYATIKYSGEGVPLWTNRYHGPGNNVGGDGPTDVAVDGSGNVFVTGISYPINGRADYATVAYSSSGAPVWTNRYNGPVDSDDYARALAVDSNGNVFVVGESWNGSAADYATIKYSGAGVPLWTNRYHTPESGNMLAHAIAADSNGNVFVTGAAVGNPGGGIATLKYSNTGTLLWTQIYQGPSAFGFYDDGRAVAVDGSGNVIVTGRSYAENNSDDGDFVTIAYSNAGVPLWTRRYNGPANGDDVPINRNALGIGPDGSVYVAGASDMDASTERQYQFVVVKYAPPAPQAPEIAVEDPVGASLVDGGSTVQFSSIVPGNASDRTFTIRNTGSVDLTNISVVIDGSDASSFSMIAQPAASIPASNGSTRLTVRFSPVDRGLYTATLHVLSNDTDENPFDIALLGSGTNGSPTAGADAATTAWQTAIDIDVLANDTDPEGDVLTITEVSGGAHGTTQLIATAGSPRIRYTPALDYSGSDSFTYTISDGFGGTSVGSVGVTIAPKKAKRVTTRYSNGDAVPGAGDPSTGVPSGSTWRNFGVPSIGSNGAVAFAGTLTTAEGALGVIYLGNDGDDATTGSFEYVVAKNGDAAAGVPGATFEKFKDPLLNETATVVFLARLNGGGQWGIWKHYPGEAASAPFLVARTGTEAAGVPGAMWKAFTSVALSDGPPGEELIAFTGKMQIGKGGVTNASDTALWIARDGAVSLGLREGAIIPIEAASKRIASFTALQPVPWAAGQGNGVTMRGGVLAKVKFDDGTQGVLRVFMNEQGIAITPVALTGSTVTGGKLTSLGVPTQSSDGRAALIAGVDRALDVGILREEDTAPTFVARTGDEALASDAAVFSGFSSVAKGVGSRLAFVAQITGVNATPANNLGIWLRDGATLHLVARKGAQPPGMSAGAKWASFPSLALGNQSFGPLFIGKLAVPDPGRANPARITYVNNTGVWVVDSTGELQLIARTGDPFDAQRNIRALTLLSHVPGSPSQTRSFSAAGEVVYRATLTDGSQHIVVVRIP
jgi:uncharacterized delta-60 repeat protein